MLDQIKYIIGGGLLVLILILAVYSSHLAKENAKLIQEAATAAEAGKEAQTAAVDCSKGVEQVQAAEQTKTEAAQAAVAEAKKDAQVNYNNAAVILARKPAAVTVVNGPADNKKLEDYEVTQEFLNEVITSRGGK